MVKFSFASTALIALLLSSALVSPVFAQGAKSYVVQQITERQHRAGALPWLKLSPDEVAAAAKIGGPDGSEMTVHDYYQTLLSSYQEALEKVTKKTNGLDRSNQSIDYKFNHLLKLSPGSRDDDMTHLMIMLYHHGVTRKEALELREHDLFDFSAQVTDAILVEHPAYEDVEKMFEAIDNYKANIAELENIVAIMRARLFLAKHNNLPEADRLQAEFDQQVALLKKMNDSYDSIVAGLKAGQYENIVIAPELLNSGIDVAVNSIKKPYQDAVVELMDSHGGNKHYGSLTLDELETNILHAFLNPETASDAATTTVERFLNDRPTDIAIGTQVYNVKIEGRDLTLVVNFTTGQVVGFGEAGLGTVNGSSINFAQGAFVGKLNADKTQIIGEFLGLTGSSLAPNMFGAMSGDPLVLRIVDLPGSVLFSRTPGDITGHLFTGINVGIDKTLSYVSTLGAGDPYKIGKVNTVGVSSNTPITYEGFARMTTQDRATGGYVQSDAPSLAVTVNTTPGQEDVIFTLDSVNHPVGNSVKAVVNDRVAAAVGHLSDNVLRTGVMFPLESYDHINLVHITDFMSGLDTSAPDNVSYGFGVVGKPTPVSDMPSGSATYNGGSAGYVTEFLKPVGGPDAIVEVSQFYGQTELNVNFNNNGVSGSIKTFRVQDETAIDNFIVNGNVSGNGLSLSLSSAGGAVGQGYGSFFGANAQEVGGQFDAFVIDTGGAEIKETRHDGVFWGKR